MATKSMTAPLAIIKFNGVAIGKMKNIRLTESIGRGTIRGIGRLTPEELPATSWDGTLNCSMYLIDFKKAMNFIDSAVPSANGFSTVLQRAVNTPEEFVDTILLMEDGLTVDILRKTKASQDPNSGVVQSQLETFASIKGCFITREGMDISESAIGGRDADFSYTTPVIFS